MSLLKKTWPKQKVLELNKKIFRCSSRKIFRRYFPSVEIFIYLMNYLKINHLTLGERFSFGTYVSDLQWAWNSSNWEAPPLFSNSIDDPQGDAVVFSGTEESRFKEFIRASFSFRTVTKVMANIKRRNYFGKIHWSKFITHNAIKFCDTLYGINKFYML